MMKARPDLRTSQCHKCQGCGHHQETCTNTRRCGVCANSHLTSDDKCRSEACNGGPKCTHTPIRRVNCPTGQNTLHKSMDWSCPAQAEKPSEPPKRKSGKHNSRCLTVAHPPHRHSQSAATELRHRKGLHPLSTTRDRHIKRNSLSPPTRTLAQQNRTSTIRSKL